MLRPPFTQDTEHLATHTHANYGTHCNKWECSHRLQVTQIGMQICLCILCEWFLRILVRNRALVGGASPTHKMPIYPTNGTFFWNQGRIQDFYIRAPRTPKLASLIGVVAQTPIYRSKSAVSRQTDNYRWVPLYSNVLNPNSHLIRSPKQTHLSWQC